VKQHFSTEVQRNTFMSLSKRSVSFSCVDSRSEDPILGTPGGDFSVLAEGVAVYLQLTGETNFTDDAALDLFKAFMDTIKGKKRKVRGAGGGGDGRRGPARPASPASVGAVRSRAAARWAPPPGPSLTPRAPSVPRPRPAPLPAPRQFYFHTSDEKLRDYVFKDVNAATGKKYVTLPDK
jgi:hypothetical protein